MQIIQATFGVFHQFDLARELLAAGHLKRIYSTFPWRRLQREGIPREYVETFPWIHTSQHLLDKHGFLSSEVHAWLSIQNAATFNYWLSQRVPSCDAFIALSGAGIDVGHRVQKEGGAFIVDRGSTHPVHQWRVQCAEYERWGLQFLSNEREIVRDVALFNQADAITVPSSVARRTFLAQGVDPAKVITIPYGVRLDHFSKTADPPDVTDRFEAIFVGAVSLRKGIPYLLQAFAGLRHPNKRLRVVGHIASEMRSLLPNLPQTQVEFLGSVPQAELAAMMSSSHVLVLPSIEEGLALVQGQALACGCPVIATEASGAEDLFTDGVEGFILPSAEPTLFTAAMQQLIDEPSLQQRMSEAALVRVQMLGGWKRYGDRWIELLHRLTGKD